MRFAVTISLLIFPVALRAQQRACEPAQNPKQLPAAGALVDSAAASSGLATIDAPDGMLFSIALPAGDSVPLVRPLFGTDSTAAAILARWIRPQKPAGETWAIRMRAARGPEQSLRVERAVFCPPVFIRPAGAPIVVHPIANDQFVPNHVRIIVTTLVSESGVPEQLKIVGSSGVPDIDQEMEDVWRRAQYRPASLDGLPVRAWYRSDQPRPEPPSLPPADDDSVYLESAVDEPPQMMYNAYLIYPDHLRIAGIQGRVVVQAVVDKNGRVESRSVRVIETADQGFNECVTSFVRHATFRPGSIDGRAVRVRVSVPIEFKISP